MKIFQKWKIIKKDIWKLFWETEEEASKEEPAFEEKRYEFLSVSWWQIVGDTILRTFSRFLFGVLGKAPKIPRLLK